MQAAAGSLPLGFVPLERRTACAIGNQPLTAPIVIPCVKYFWKQIKMVTIGIAASAAPAISGPYSMTSADCSRAIPSAIVRFSVLVSMTSWRK